MNLLTYLCIITVLRTLPIVVLMPYTFWHKLRYSSWCTVLLSGALLTFQVLMAIYTFQPGYLSGWTRMGASLLALMFLFTINLAFYRVTSYQILFTILVIKGYCDNVSLFVQILQAGFQQNDSMRILSLQALLNGVLLAITLPFVALFMKKCIRPIVDNGMGLPFWRLLWCIPAAFYFLYRLGVYPGYLGGKAYSPQGAFLLPYVWSATTFLSYYIILKMLSETSKNAHLEERLHISNLQIDMQRELYESLRSSVEDTRRLRHNIRHHLAALKGYTGKGDSPGAEKYLDGLMDSFRSEEALCENYAIDAIARHYITLAEKQSADVEIVLDLPQTLAVPESDICVILGNLLENAVEACARQIGGGRFICVKAGIIGHNMIAITVRNSFSGEIRRNGEAFLSSKRDGEGIGIASVRSITEKYRGTAKFEYTDNVFSASALLNP